MSVHTPLPPAIANETDLAAQRAALIRLAPDLAPVFEMAGEIPMRHLDPGYAGLVWVITGQQVSVAAATAIFRRLEALLGSVSPENVRAASDEDLRTAGLSIQKIRTFRAAAEFATEHDLSALAKLDSANAIAELTSIKGVGRWTAEVFLLFALGHPDVFPAGDLALQDAARSAFGLEARPPEKELLLRAEAWRPHRSVAARLLWAYYRAVRNGRYSAPV